MRFFHIPAVDPHKPVEELNRFLAGHRVLNQRSEFVSNGDNSYWSVCINYVSDEVVSGAPAGRGKPGVDYREVLSPPDFSVYAKLRDLRRALAEKDGQPAFSVFTNEQMANLVRSRVVTLAAMQKISGIGAAKVSKYGTQFLALLREAFPEVSVKSTHEAIESHD